MQRQFNSGNFSEGLAGVDMFDDTERKAEIKRLRKEVANHLIVAARKKQLNELHQEIGLERTKYEKDAYEKDFLRCGDVGIPSRLKSY